MGKDELTQLSDNELREDLRSCDEELVYLNETDSGASISDIFRAEEYRDRVIAALKARGVDPYPSEKRRE